MLRTSSWEQLGAPNQADWQLISSFGGVESGARYSYSPPPARDRRVSLAVAGRISSPRDDLTTSTLYSVFCRSAATPGPDVFPIAALHHIRTRVQRTIFTAPCKSALAAVVVPDDPSGIERGLARGFLLAKISESGFLSNRRRSNTIRHVMATGRPSPLERRRRCRLIQDKCKASSDCPSTSG